MKSYSVKILPSAQSDIAEALDYIALELCNPTAALKLQEVITECFSRLKALPYSGKKLNEEFPLKHTFYWVMAENYMIFYTIDEEARAVTIMRMLFGSSDYLSILKYEV